MVTRSHHEEKEIMQGTMLGARRRGRPHTALMNSINTWTLDRTVHGRVNQNVRGQINGESTSMVWPTLGSRTAKEQKEIIVDKAF